MREIYNFDTVGPEIGFELLPLWCSLPVTAYKHPMKTSPETHICSEFVFIGLGHHLVDISYRAHDSTALGERYDRGMMLVVHDELVRGDADYKIIALFLGPAQDVEVPDVKHVEDTGCIAYNHLLSRLRI